MKKAAAVRLVPAKAKRTVNTPAPSGDDPLMTLSEVSTMTRTPIGSVRHWIRIGQLRAMRPGRRVLVRRSEVLRMLAHSSL